MHRRAAIVAASIALAAGLTACGSSGSRASCAKVETLTATAGKVELAACDMFFTAKTIEVKAGPLEVTLLEGGAAAHTFEIDDIDDFVVSVSAGKKSATGSVTLEAGTYTFFCSVPGHRGAGMEGTLVVT